jgi:hypothetical protein
VGTAAAAFNASKRAGSTLMEMSVSWTEYNQKVGSTALALPSFASRLLPPPTSESFSFFPGGAAFFCDNQRFVGTVP